MVLFVKSFVVFVFRFLVLTAKETKANSEKKIFKRLQKVKTIHCGTLLPPFEFLFNQPFVYSFAVKKFAHAVYRNFRF